MSDRNTKLRALMEQHDLAAADVAELLGRELITVRIWLCKPGNRQIPSDALSLLELKLASKAGK
jgi:hypothetical protein